VRGGLSLVASGSGYWSHVIGGFEALPIPTPSSAVDEESVDVLREFTSLKLRLMPYLYQAAVPALDTGEPVGAGVAAEVRLR
jgi:alpha-D-xyloside xylohydrolase